MTALTPTDAIPADILAAAENALDTLLCNCREAGDVRQDSILDIARAILAERERCAQIAETCTVKADWASEIAAAIRKPHSLPFPSQATDMAGAEFPPLAAPATHSNPPFAAPAVPHTTTPSSESPEGEAQSLSGEPSHAKPLAEQDRTVGPAPSEQVGALHLSGSAARGQAALSGECPEAPPVERNPQGTIGNSGTHYLASGDHGRFTRSSGDAA